MDDPSDHLSGEMQRHRNVNDIPGPLRFVRLSSNRVLPHVFPSNGHRFSDLHAIVRISSHVCGRHCGDLHPVSVVPTTGSSSGQDKAKLVIQ